MDPEQVSPQQAADTPVEQDTTDNSQPNPSRFPYIPFIVGLLALVVFFIYLAVGLTYFSKDKKTVRPLPKPTAQATAAPPVTPVPPTSDETSQWQTYTNTDIGYSIRYPVSIDTTHYKSSDGSFVQILLPDIQATSAAERNLRITDMVNPSSTFQEFVDTQLLPNKTNIKKQAPYTLITVTGVIFTQSFPVTNIEKHSIWIQKNNTLLAFEISFLPENKQKTVEHFNRILSTFTLLP